MVELFFTYLQRGDMRVSDLITHRYSPQMAPESYRMLQTDRSEAMGVLFDWTRDWKTFGLPIPRRNS